MVSGNIINQNVSLCLLCTRTIQHRSAYSFVVCDTECVAYHARDGGARQTRGRQAVAVSSPENRQTIISNSWRALEQVDGYFEYRLTYHN